ncbi:hypothetical protein LTR10_023585 [Elasticomyces elasticus]|nr:hypothetical protein LTR10_023585 [Elasticomyces elasticus]KAK5024159.1 hypothetical protein LTS07_008894 [Exophiala sideris]KAK5028981.1 hypothetical protein LTR13_008850 [Exophiala sideris]KAK5178804.1 hypothetical protein LTR44_008631 [Eurotiomycetes sp. CCFEE 6388]
MRRNLCTALAISAGIATAAPLAGEASEPHLLRTRNIVDTISESYDFVIVGGGLAGLVLGGRLSEDSNHTVLVLEAGGDGDDYRERIDTPSDAYYNSLWPTPLNWAFNTTPQAGMNNTQMEWPRGKVLGGSSAINGLYMNRPGEIEVNAWKDLLTGMDGADNWSWDSLYAAMKTSETFTPASSNIAQEAGITYDASSHGTNGPIQMSYPGYTFPLVGEWSDAMRTVGVPVSQDTYGGENWGAYVSTSAINPTNWTRSYSRSGYLDPLPPRSNYDVLANAYVTRLIFNSSSPPGNLTADSVEYSPDDGATKLTVKVNKEVILAGGTVGSPAVLLYSGVGPKDVLDGAGVTVVSELPGVGHHLQDHLSATVQFGTDQATAGSIYASNGSETTNAAFLSYVNSAVAYVNATNMFGTALGSLQSSIIGEIDTYAASAGTDATVIAGYKAIYNTTVNTILTSPIGQVEMLIGNNLNGTINIGASLQHPYSHGQVYINSSNPMDYPVINPNYLNHPADIQILREGIKLARALGQANPLSGSLTAETSPGSDVQTDDEWNDWLREVAFTEYHPSSSCAMLPLEQGGVVDANLRVYGLANVRVADASVPPIAFSAHLMSATYGLAEQASTIIRNYHNIGALAKSNSHNSTTSSNSTSTTSSKSSASSVTSSGASNITTTSIGSDGGFDVKPWTLLATVTTCIVFGFWL